MKKTSGSEDPPITSRVPLGNLGHFAVGRNPPPEQREGGCFDMIMTTHSDSRAVGYRKCNIPTRDRSISDRPPILLTLIKKRGLTFMPICMIISGFGRKPNRKERRLPVC